MKGLINSLKIEAKISFNKFGLGGWFDRLFRYHFIESLILAQDERWRRA